LVVHRLSNAEWETEQDSILSKLVELQLLERRSSVSFFLTQMGQARASKSLGMERLAKGTTWASLKRSHLIARALGLAPNQQLIDRLRGADGMRAVILKARRSVGTNEVPTLNQVRDALIWKQLGIESDRPFTLGEARKVLLQRALPELRANSPEQMLRQLAAQSVGAKRADADELRRALLQGWVLPEAQVAKPAPTTKSDGLQSFAMQVLQIARSVSTGHFGADKVFISHVYRALPAPQPTEADFKNQLVEANRARLVTLSRADLVEAMNPEDVAASETRYLGATFHFISLQA
jgi:hypothetical protein